ncbi:MAG: hypothetical protein AB7L76_24420 [Burkholderiaceae bacterium]
MRPGAPPPAPLKRGLLGLLSAGAALVLAACAAPGPGPGDGKVQPLPLPSRGPAGAGGPGAAGGPGPVGPGAGAPGAAAGRSVTVLTLPIARPQLRVGDRWVYAGREIGTAATYQSNLVERSIVSVNGDRAQLRQVALDPKTRKPTGAPRMRAVKPSSWHLDPGGRSSGEVRALAFPLTLDKEWRYEYSVAPNDRDAVTLYSYLANVAGLDSVETPAGRFDTVRVIHQGEWRRSVLEKGEPVMRSGRVTQVYWYAPAVNSWVRLEVELFRPDGSRELGIVQELVDYSRRP